MKYFGIALFAFVAVGDHHRRRLDHQGDDHPPFRFRSIPVHAQEVTGDHMTETSQGVLSNVLGWLHQGYPEGVPQKDYFALLALLKRSLTEDEVVQAAQAVLKKSAGDRHRKRGRDSCRRAESDRKRAEPGGDPSGGGPAGLRGLATGGLLALNRLTSGGPWLDERRAASVSGVPAQRMGLGHLDEDQRDAVGIGHMQLVQTPRLLPRFTRDGDNPRSVSSFSVA